ncbi:MAG: hypothetical protein QXG39_00155 [Candidatus Aenigmatarchaeota archaeon]
MVKFGEKSLSNIVILFFLIGLVILSFFILKFRGTLEVLSGGQAISLSKVDFVSNDATLNKKAWLLTIVQEGSAQYAYGSFSADQIVDSYDKVKAGGGVSIQLSLDKQNCEYKISRTYSYLYRIQAEKKECWVGLTCGGKLGYNAPDWQRECEQKAGYYAFYKEPWSWNYWCFWLTREGEVGIIGTKSTVFESTIKVTTPNGTFAGKINSKEAKSVWIKEGDIYASWIGNLVTGDECPNPGDYHIGGVYTTSWKIVNYDKVLQAQLYISSRSFESCVNNYGVDSCLKQYDNILSSALAPVTFKSSGGAVANTYGSEDNGLVVINLSRAVQYPAITLKISTSYLPTISLVQLVGRPKIVNIIVPEKMYTGGDNFLTVEVKNIGDARGTFDVFVTCQAYVSQSGTSQQISLEPGETGTVYIPMSASSEKEVATSCTVVAQDRSNPINKDSRTVTVKVSPIVICQPGEKRCNGKYIEVCNQVGSGWVVEKVCDYGCDYKDGIPYCKEAPKEEKETECAWWDLGCHLNKMFEGIAGIFEGVVGFFKLLGLLLGIIGGLLVFLLVRQKVGSDMVTTVVGIILAFVVILLVYFYWWFFIIIVIIYFLISTLIKGRLR